MAGETSATGTSWTVKFLPFSSAADSPFWVQYCQEKLEKIQLSEAPVPIRASYGLEGPPRLQCQQSSLQIESSTGIPNERVAVDGVLIGFNTIESFQKVDKNKLLAEHFVEKFMKRDFSCLTSVVLLTFPDLKNHKVLYWFGMPALLTKKACPIRALHQERLGDIWSEKEMSVFSENIQSFRLESLDASASTALPPFFAVTNDGCKSLQSLGSSSNELDLDSTVFSFFDPAGPSEDMVQEQPMGWPMRNLVAYLSFHLNLGGKTVKLLSCRPKVLRRITESSAAGMDCSDSILLRIVVPTMDEYNWGTESKKEHKVVGWELNTRNKPGPRWVNLKPLLDSKHLAVQAADLNLKLMKWRMIPTLDVEMLQSTKVLMIGAGTLGCSVARTLLGWGVRKIDIVDYGNVSYSNPVRQSLFTLADCNDEKGVGRPKAVAAAEQLRAIAADVETQGIIASIPMPGHEESRESIETSVCTLDKLVQDCDVVYLLTDTRESRWLPTLMAAVHDKILINAALGLDSWLVMRHGRASEENPKNKLGCYFCGDIVSAANSTKNRTLDQQCTVTRPGLAPIASSMAVELMVSILHHPLRHAAPAPMASTSVFSPSTNDASASPLGVMPHQIRGSLVSYTMMTPTVSAFDCCTACSQASIEAYKEDKIGLVYEACRSPDGSFLENLSGLTAFRENAAAKLEDFEEWDDDENGVGM